MQRMHSRWLPTHKKRKNLFCNKYLKKGGGERSRLPFPLFLGGEHLSSPFLFASTQANPRLGISPHPGFPLPNPFFPITGCIHYFPPPSEVQCDEITGPPSLFPFPECGFDLRGRSPSTLHLLITAEEAAKFGKCRYGKGRGVIYQVWK